MEKKGEFNADFTISLAIFVLFLAWFMIFIRPVFRQDSRLNPVAELFEEKMIESFSWEVQRLPIIVNSPYDLNNYASISRFNYGWESNNSGLLNQKPFGIVDNRIFFISDLKQGANVKLLANSEYVYNNTWQITRADFSEKISNVNNLKVEFLDSIPINGTYKGNQRFENFEYLVSKRTAEIRETKFDDYSFFSIHKVDFGAFDVSHVVFVDNTRLLGLIDKKTTTDIHNITLKIEIIGYSNYHSNNVFQDEIDYSSERCYSWEEQYINFYNSQNSMTIYFDNLVNIKLCIVPNSQKVIIEFTSKLKDINYEIMFHEGDYEFTKNKINLFSVKYGPVETYNLFSEQKVSETLNQTYSSLRSQTGLSNFNICIAKLNQTTKISEFCSGKELPLVGDIFSEQKNCKFMSPYGEISDCKMLLQVW